MRYVETTLEKYYTLSSGSRFGLIPKPFFPCQTFQFSTLNALYPFAPHTSLSNHLPIPRQVHRLSRQDRPFVGQNSTKQEVETDHPSCWARRLLPKKTRGPCGRRAHHIGLSGTGSAFQDHLWPFL